MPGQGNDSGRETSVGNVSRPYASATSVYFT